MIVEIISVGTEILLGNIVNTNAAYLAEKCAGLGLSCYYQDVVGDNEERLMDVFQTALSRADILLLSGGLGPTQDDLTKETAAKVFGKKLYLHEPSKEAIAAYFQKKGMEITDNNWKQAMVPEGADVLHNSNGTAPGLILRSRDGQKHVILLPGPPGELVPLFEEQVVPYLQRLTSSVICSKTVKIFGLGESMAEDQICDLIEGQTNPTIAPYAKTGEVHLRVTAQASCKEEAERLLQPVCDELIGRFSDHVYTTDERETLEENIASLLRQQQLTLTTAESCTGGLLSGRIVGAAGVSQVFRQGFVTYSNEAKMQLLGVKESTLAEHGAVSEETAQEMAEGAAKAAGADAALAVTGIAGPDGGTEEKPVGLVYIGCYLDGKTYVRKCNFSGNRQKIREQSVAYALCLLRKCLGNRNREQ